MKRDINLVDSTAEGGGGGGDDEQKSKKHKDNLCTNTVDDDHDTLVITNASQDNNESKSHDSVMIDSHSTSYEFTIKETSQECHIVSGCVGIITNVASIQSKNEKQVSIPTPNIRNLTDINKCERSSVFRDRDSSTTYSKMTIVNRKEQHTLLPWNVIDDGMISSSSDSDNSSKTTENDEHLCNQVEEKSFLRPATEQIEKRTSILRLLRFICIILLSGLIINARFQRHLIESGTSSSSSIYVAGGGFSGFWYTIGRLQSMDHQRKLSSDYYCYSAGCIAVIASLNNFTMEHMYHIASNKQKQLHDGIINRYEVAPQFIDNLLSFHNRADSDPTINGTTDGNMKEVRKTQQLSLQHQDLVHPLQDMLSRIHVISTELHGNDWWSYLRPKYSQASTIEEMKQLLMQTTWIPYAIGNGLSYQGHLDGAFSYYSHSSCDYQVSLTWDMELIINILNIHLSHEQVKRLWNKGLEYGV